MRELTDLEDALPEMSFVMMHVCRIMWLLCQQRSEGEWSPIHAIRKRVNSSRRTSIFMTIQVGTILDFSSGHSPLSSLDRPHSWRWHVCGEICELFKDASASSLVAAKCLLNSIVVGFSMSWVSWCEREEIWSCVRRPQWDWLTIVTWRWCGTWVDVFSVYLLWPWKKRLRRRTVRKPPVWRAVPANPTPSRDPTTHVGTSFQIRGPLQQSLRVRSGRVFPVSEHGWMRMEIDRIDRWRFGFLVALPDDALTRGARGLMTLPGGESVAVQRMPSNDLTMFVNRAVDGMLPSPGDPRKIRDETFWVGEDESVDKKKTMVSENLQMICGLTGLNMMLVGDRQSLARLHPWGNFWDLQGLALWWR